MGNEVEEVKARVDLVDLVSQYVTLKKAGANYKGSCPFHQEKTASLMVSPQKQIWKCFGCGKGGDAFKFVMEIEHLEFGDALRMLAQKAGVTLQPRTKAEHQTQGRKEKLYRINNLASLVWQKLLWEGEAGQAALGYLKNRQITEQTIKLFRLGWAPKNLNLRTLMAKHEVTAGDLSTAGNPEKFYERIMFPIFDVLGNVIAFTGRTLGDGQPKYLNSPETPLYAKSRVLYGLNFAKAGIKEKNYVVLVEGQMDVVALHQAGATNTVASSGTAITESQLIILSKYTDSFLLAFDADAAGINTTKKVIELCLKNDLNVKVADFGEYKDAGELLANDPKAWPDKVKTAEEAVEWLLQKEIAQIGEPRFVENKKALIKALLPVLALISEPTRLDHYVARLGQAMEVKPEALYESLKRVKSQIPSLGNSTLERSEKNPKSQTNSNTQTVNSKIILTPEEQLLALFLHRPSLLDKHRQAFDEIVWQSAEADRIANVIGSCYNDKTLVKNSAQFSARVKTTLNSQLDEKISSNPQNSPTPEEKLDGWQFWLSSAWPNLDDNLADELVAEKIGQLATKSYEHSKEKLAQAIRVAQEKDDGAEIKKLMQKLNQLTKRYD
ncbi:MAG TPA: DNA primase [Candidatus Saccharimonadales bacterium]|nr:DNA primase [Candidatus Saccharimonadales bacterium]